MTSVAGDTFFGWPSEGASLLCTKAKPRPPIQYSDNFKWQHVNRVQVGGCSEGCCADFLCSACGLRHSEGVHGQSPA
jgi:hypothetical protein